MKLIRLQFCKPKRLEVEMTGVFVFVFPQIIVSVFSRYYIEQRAL